MQARGIRDRLLSELEQDDLSIEQLVSRTEELLAVLAPRQTRYKVSERPDVRTIRYYTSRSLLPRPVGYQGGRARYSGSHLVRLLLIKKLQAEHYNLRKIAAELENKDDRAVLRALVPAVEPSSPGPSGPARAADVSPPAMRSLPIRRIAVTPEANLDVAEATLADPKKRDQLADALRALARELSKHHRGEEP
ncbi:MAG: helix-turn-helix domain-containing protein [Proteobacteria bacterium]|nr:helix-turn-helix domain-containing protein [Pseudomonadota bacterium]